MSSIDDRIVQMQFQNSQFEKGVAESLKSLEKLKEGLQLEKAAEGLKRLQEAGDSFSLAKVSESVDGLGERFSAFGTFAARIIENLADTVYHKLGSALESVTVGQIAKGWGKYKDDTEAVQTIMFATGKSIEEVEEQLRKLTFFTDETSYSYSDMVSNISKFTSNNIDLTDARVAMQGIATWAASAGQNAQTASRAMYNISQAMGVGAMKNMDWKSIELANMATTDFKKNAINAAIALGTLDSAGRTLDKHHTQVTIENFRETLTNGWFSKDVMMHVFNQYGEFAEKVQELVDETGMDASDAIAQLSGTTELFSENAFKAAQEAKTFNDAIEALRDATSTKWLNIFKLIFGNYEQAKTLWTKLANDLYAIFVDPLDTLVEKLRDWHKTTDENGHELYGSWDDFMQGVFDFMDGLKGLVITIRDAFANLIPGVTVTDLRHLAISVRDFGKAFKEAFGLPDEAEGVEDVVNGVGDAVKRVGEIVTGTTNSSTKDIKILNAEAVKLQNELKKGSTGKEVKKMQEQLLGAGYSLDKFGADGIWGPETQAAWEAFCKDAGLSIDSVFDEAASQSLAEAFDINRTKELLGELTDSLKMGDKSEEVKKLQERLIALGFNLDRFGADGIWGPETQKAYEEFCKAYDLDPAQEYDQKTHAIMVKALRDKYGVETVEELVEKTKESKDAAEKYGNKLDAIKMIFGGIAAAGGIVLKIVGLIGNVLTHIWEITEPIRNAFLVAGAAIGEALVNFNNWLGTEGAIESWFASVTKYLEPVAKWISDAADSFLIFFGLKKPVEESNKEITTFSTLWRGIVDSVQKSAIFQNIVTAFNSVKEAIDKIRPSLKQTKDSFKKNLGNTLTNILKVLGGALLVVLAPIGALIGLLGKFIGFVVSYIPKGIEILKGFWESLTFEGDESLGKAPGILAKAKNFLGNISDFLFGKDEENGEKKVGIFTRIGALLKGDMVGFTEGMSEEDAAKAIEFSEKVKGIYETIKSNIDKAFAVISLLFTGNVNDAAGLSSDTINNVYNVKDVLTKIGQAINLLFTGTDSEGSLLSEETKSKINQFRTTVTGILDTIKDAIVSVGEGIWYLFGGSLSENKTISDGSIEAIQRFKNKLSEIFGLIYILFTGNKRNGATDWKRWATENELGVLGFRNTIIGYFDKAKNVFATIGAAINLLFTGSDGSGLISDEWKERIIWFRDKCISIFDGIRDGFAKAWPRVKLLFTGDDKNTTLDKEDAEQVINFRNKIIKFFQNVGKAFRKIWAAIAYIFTGKGAEGILSKGTIEKLDNFRKWVSDTFSGIKGFFVDLYNQLKGVFANGINFDSIKAALLLVWEKILGFFNTLSSTAKKIIKWAIIGFVLYKVLKIIGQITGFFDSIRSGIMAFKGNSESLATSILKFAGAIGIIGAAIWLIGTQMNQAQFNQGMTAFKWIVGAIAGFMILSAVFTRKKPDKEASTLSDAVWDIAKSIGILTAAVWVLGSLIDWGTFGNGLVKMGILMVVLGGFILGLKALEKKMGNSMSLSLEGKIWQLAIVIGAMGLVVKLLGKMDFGQALIGVGALAGIMISLGLFMRLASRYGEFKLKGFISLSIAVGIIAFVVKRLAKLSLGQALQGVGAVAVILGMMALLARTFGKYGDDIKISQMITMFIGIAAIIGLFYFIVKRIKDVNPGVMLSFSGSLALALGAFVAACLIVGKVNKSAGENVMLDGALSILGALFAFAATAVVLVGALGFLDRALGGGAQDAFARGAEILKLTAGAIKGFMDELDADLGDVAIYLGSSTIAGMVNGGGLGKGFFSNNAMLNGASSIVLALLIFALACLILVGGIGALDEIDKEHSLADTFEKGGDVLEKTGAGIKKFMNALGIGFEDLALVIGASAVVGLLKIGGDLVTGAFMIGLAIDAFIFALEAFVGVNGFVNKISNGGWADLIDSGGEVLSALGSSLAKFVTGAMDEFSGSIENFANAIGTLRDKIDGISEDQDLDADIAKSLLITGQMHRFFNGLNGYAPNPTGIKGYNTAAESVSSDMGAFGTNVNRLWKGITRISLDKDIDNDLQKSIEVANTLKTQFFDVIQDEMPTGIGLWLYNTKISSLLGHVKTFGDNLGSLHRNLKGAHTSIEKDTEAAINAATSVHDFLKYLNDHNGEIENFKIGASAWFGTDTDQETVFKSIDLLAQSIGSAKTNLSNIGSASLIKGVQTATTVAKEVTKLLLFLQDENIAGKVDFTQGAGDLDKLSWWFDPNIEGSITNLLWQFSEETANMPDATNAAKMLEGLGNIASYLSNTEAIQTEFTDTGVDMIGSIITGFQSYDEELLKTSMDTLISGVEAYVEDFNTVGYNLMIGMVNGIGDAEELALLAVQNVCKHMLGRAMLTLQEKSPSKATTKMGEYFTKGLAIGIGNKEDDAVSSTQTVAESMLDTAQGTLMSLSQLLAQDLDVDPVISPVVDLTNARESAASISSMFSNSDSGITVTRTLADRTNYNGNGELLMKPTQINAESLSILQTDLDTISRGLANMSNTDVVDGLNTMSDNFAELSEAVRNMKLVLDTGALVGGTSAAYDREFGIMSGRRERGN